VRCLVPSPTPPRVRAFNHPLCRLQREAVRVQGLQQEVLRAEQGVRPREVQRKWLQGRLWRLEGEGGVTLLNVHAKEIERGALASLERGKGGYMDTM
jgi:hypothetical protein